MSPWWLDKHPQIKKAVSLLNILALAFPMLLTGMPALSLKGAIEPALAAPIETRITTNTMSQWQPAISGDKIVYRDERGSYSDIYMYDLTAEIETRITTNAAMHDQPAIFNNTVVYSDDRDGGIPHIFMYDLAGDIESQVATGSGQQLNPAVHGDKIVWDDYRNGNYDIYMYDTSSATETQITVDGSKQEKPAIWGDKIVWEDWRNGHSDIYMYDLTAMTETRITTDTSHQYNAAIHGDKVVWFDDRAGDNNVYMYDISALTETQITTDPAGQQEPVVFGNRIAWVDWRNDPGDYSNPNIYAYDLTTGLTSQMTDNAARQESPAIDGNNLVWQDRRNGEYDIYSRTLDGVPGWKPPAGLVSWWRGEGDANDVMGANNGVLVNDTTFSPGNTGQALSFDGTADYVQMPGDAFAFGGEPFTVEFWINSSTTGGTDYLMGKSDPDSGLGFDIRLRDGEILAVGVNGWPADHNLTSGALVVPDTWYHVALSVSDTTAALYVDGVQKEAISRSISNTVSTATNPFRMGWTSAYGGSAFDGLLDEVAIYNRALTGPEIEQIHDSGPPPDLTPPITTATVDPAEPDGDNGWYTTAPAVTLTPDEPAAVYYQWDSTATWEGDGLPDASVTVPGIEGTHTLYYRSIDSAGNTETINSLALNVDAALPDDPDTVISTSHTTGTPSNDNTIDIAFSGAADTTSGVAGYSVLFDESTTTAPPEVVTMVGSGGDTTETTTSGPLLDGSWYAHISTVDIAGNWTSTVHLGPFIIDTVAPTTDLTTTPPGPDGENGWFITRPNIGLAAHAPVEPVIFSYQWDSTATANWQVNSFFDVFYELPLPAPEGQHTLYYRGIDEANNTETTPPPPLSPEPPEPFKRRQFKVDTLAPSGTIQINDGAIYTKSRGVTLSLAASDVDSGVAMMRFKDDGGGWTGWEAYQTTKGWTLPFGEGVKKVWAQFKDEAGNESAAVLDTIFLDTLAPTTTLDAPRFSTDVSKTKTFKVSWVGVDPIPGSGVNVYDVQYKIGSAGAWANWKPNTAMVTDNFAGSAGKTYFFRARAKDWAGNVGAWSVEKRTIVPLDQSKGIVKRVGFAGIISKASSSYYLGTVRYSEISGDEITYSFTGNHFALIGTKGPKYSKAVVIIDGVKKTIDAKAASKKFRQVLMAKTLTMKKHTVKIQNLGTAGRGRFEIDGNAVGK